MYSKIVIVFCLMMPFVFCDATDPDLNFRNLAQKHVCEVSINGHTYIYANYGSNVAICPSAETLMWAYSHRTNASFNGEKHEQ